jgi:CheY-like chemotaxis protein
VPDQPATLVTRSLARAPTSIQTVLVVDPEPQSLVQALRVLDDLGHAHRSAASAREALSILAQDSTIGIILAEADLPTMDGQDLIEEVHARTGSGRPVAAILANARPTADMAIRAMRAGAIDFVSKPYNASTCAAALRVALHWLDRHRSRPQETASDFGDQLARVISLLEAKGPLPAGDRDIGTREVAATLRAIIASRSLRNRHFPTEIFADPAWDILLDLTRADLDRQPVSVSSVCIAASVPMSTALRWVRQMTEAGLLQRWTDPKDKRRDLIALTEPTAASMRDYLAAACATLRRI